jgi:protein-S-isoprenylcysteine O-methyltransferase Ste14
MSRSTDTAGIIAPPPLLTLLCVLAGFALERGMHLPLVHGHRTPRMALGVAIFVAACALTVVAVMQFRRHGTDPNPYRPSSVVVDSGVYRFTRNPIYVGFMLVVVAFAVGANTRWMLVMLPILFALLHFGVVRREERYLSARFGASYDDYRARVRRWL